jgi:AraC-like DNA-binding protein
MVDPSIFTSDERLRRVKDLVQRGLDRPLHLSDGAAEVGLELKYFSKDFQARAGVSFRQWRSQERLNEARNLLARQDLTIWQVAERVGLSESSFKLLQTADQSINGPFSDGLPSLVENTTVVNTTSRAAVDEGVRSSRLRIEQALLAYRCPRTGRRRATVTKTDRKNTKTDRKNANPARTLRSRFQLGFAPVGLAFW